MSKTKSLIQFLISVIPQIRITLFMFFKSSVILCRFLKLLIATRLGFAFKFIIANPIAFQVTYLIIFFIFFIFFISMSFLI